MLKSTNSGKYTSESLPSNSIYEELLGIVGWEALSCITGSLMGLEGQDDVRRG